MMAPLAPLNFASSGLGPPQMDGDRDREEHRRDREHRHRRERQPADYDVDLSRRLSHLLRHKDTGVIRSERLPVGDEGWTPFSKVLERLNYKANLPVTRQEVMEVVHLSRKASAYGDEDKRFEYKTEADQEFVRATTKRSLDAARRTTGEPRATAATSASTTPPAPTTAHDDADDSYEKERIADLEVRNTLLHEHLINCRNKIADQDEQLAQRDVKIAQLEERIAQLEGRSDGAAPVPSAAPAAPAPGAVDVGAAPESSTDTWL